MEEPAKGTVTSLSSLFPAEEAQKASKRVQDTIAERRKQLDLLRDFVADNNSLINLVQRLPDQLHHDIMVPFGKAAFFPGRLNHTNEFLVLLGEGYYVEKTSKQTSEILKRRGKDLDSQVESVKAVIQDLTAEASFFDATASEAAEGLLEIREDYVEETSPEGSSTVGIVKPELPISPEGDNPKLAVEDEEYACILSRMDELEKEEEEEEEAENDNNFNDEELRKYGLDVSTVQHILDQEIKDSGVDGSSNLKERAASSRNHQIEGFPEQLHVESPKAVTKDECLAGSPAYDKSNVTENAPKQNRMEEDTDVPIIAENKAFTGSIIEHAGNFDTKPSKQTVGRGSKPVSRPSGPNVRSFLCFASEEMDLPREHTSFIHEAFRLVRVVDLKYINFPRFPNEMVQLVHLRYIALSGNFRVLPASISKLWNLETLIFGTKSRELDIQMDIWKMSQFKHLYTSGLSCLRGPSARTRKDNEDPFVRRNSQTISTVLPDCCKENILARTPGLRKLGIRGKLATLVATNGDSSLFDYLAKLDNL
ncbi:hypothetical protein K7X08_016298 [Anisodus acutangulus]|uniref:RNA polymerase II subunit 5-mediating protein homolog n=1 Tax=Anisodus acutangulus TaxID=402998 RepID=A0A9Q1LDH2_9SOLA|nr:hypothetical protein K7X08_016298 [Anisodus acutangulus]